jgi:hypothetical protein
MMERILIIRNGKDLAKTEKWVKRSLSETYLNITSANRGRKWYFEAHFVIKEMADTVGPVSTSTDPNGC